MGKFGICGHFSDEGGKYNGQTVKTKILMKSLENAFPGEYADKIDTQTVHSNPVKFFLGCFKLLNKNENVIILPAQSAINVLVPFFSIANKFYRKKIHYFVVGGWLTDTISKKPKLLKYLKTFNSISVELHSMEKDLKNLGLDNVIFVNKFREITFVKPEELDLSVTEPIKLCFFSRVLKEKGIEDAIDAVKKLNEEYGKTVFALDIYGPVDNGYRERFDAVKENLPEFIGYKGVLDYNTALPVLKGYFAMVFPTYYSGEGYPNAVVDAYSAGLPIIATNWKYNAEVIKDKVDGIIYDYTDNTALYSSLKYVYENSDAVAKMKINACNRAKEYEPQVAILPLVEKMK